MELVKVESHESNPDRMVVHMERETETESLVVDTDYLGPVDLAGNLEDLVGKGCLALEGLAGILEGLVGVLEDLAGVLGEIGDSQPTGALFRTCWGGRRGGGEEGSKGRRGVRKRGEWGTFHGMSFFRILFCLTFFCQTNGKFGENLKRK
jgi:hypothetical protein